ncbi:MAG TPA: MBL fold metallo-hydrolase [Lacipirellulaceae bacterium]|jgi:ribonuclease BN (tRNA processing enzyme)|nr:MBL fold metallo-hydrolase [Lacipirellulaceae bacterium]
MKLVLLGIGGYFPTRERQTACLLLPEVGIVLDAGTGMNRLAAHLKTDQLDIFLTHAHLDHIAGLTYLIKVVPEHVLANTTVHGEGPKLQAVREHLFAEAIFPVLPSFTFAPLSSPVEILGGGYLTYFPLTHPGGSVGYRLDWPGHSMAYVTDTTASSDAAYMDVIRGVDLLVHESFFADDVNDLPAITGHSTIESVAEVAAKARPVRLVLVHLDPMNEGGLNLETARRLFRKYHDRPRWRRI